MPAMQKPTGQRFLRSDFLSDVVGVFYLTLTCRLRGIWDGVQAQAAHKVCVCLPETLGG